MELSIVKEVEKRWLTNAEAQKYLGVSADYLKGMRERGFPYYRPKNSKILFYEKEQLDRYIIEGRV